MCRVEEGPDAGLGGELAATKFDLVGGIFEPGLVGILGHADVSHSHRTAECITEGTGGRHAG